MPQLLNCCRFSWVSEPDYSQMSLKDCDTLTSQRRVCDFPTVCSILQYGDYDPGVHTPGFLAREELLPKRVSERRRLYKCFESFTHVTTWQNALFSVCVLFLSVFDFFFCPPLYSFVDVFRWLTCTRWLQRCGRKGSQRATRNTGVGRGKNSCTPLQSHQWQMSVNR